MDARRVRPSLRRARRVPGCVLGIDTCGPRGRWRWRGWSGRELRVLGCKSELEGRSYSATLVAAVGELLAEHGRIAGPRLAHCRGEWAGSFTGVRVGLSAVKGLAEPGQIPVVAVSRLAVLAGRREWSRRPWMRIATRCFCGLAAARRAQGIAGGRGRTCWRWISAPCEVGGLRREPRRA